MDLPTYKYARVAGKSFVTSVTYTTCYSVCHRVDGPAYRTWGIVDDKPVLTHESWWLHGQCHRVDGPAWREWVIRDGVAVLLGEDWYLKGKLINPFASPFLRAMVTNHLHACGLVIWPGLMDLIVGYLV